MIHNKIKSIVLTGGGTGGHIYPGLGVADELRLLCPNIKIIWIGASKGIDKKIVEKSGSVDEFVGIPAGKFRRYFSLKNCIDVFKIIGAFFVSVHVLHKYKPLLVFSKGGFVSVPPCMAAKLLNIPVFTHECDYSPGLATRINARVAKKILVSFEKTKGFFDPKKQNKVIVTGNPVRPVFYAADATKGRFFLGADTSKPMLLILGGSLGARQINTLVFEQIDWLCERFILIHQTGTVDYNKAKNITNPFYKPYAFFYQEMPDVLAAADIVLGRAGSNFLWESAVTAKPLVLIPLSGSGTRGDQIENAEFFSTHNAAIVLKSKDANKNNLQKALIHMSNNDNRRAFSVNIKALVENTNPARTIAKILQTEVV